MRIVKGKTLIFHDLIIPGEGLKSIGVQRPGVATAEKRRGTFLVAGDFFFFELFKARDGDVHRAELQVKNQATQLR